MAGNKRSLSGCRLGSAVYIQPMSENPNDSTARRRKRIENAL